MRHNLRAAIQQKFRTQLECARAIAIHPIRLNRICCGWADPTRIEREKLTTALNAEATWLFSRITKIPTPTSSDAENSLGPTNARVKTVPAEAGA